MFFVLFCTIVFIVLLYSLQGVNLYWKNKKVPHSDPWPFIGNMMPFASGRRSLFEIVHDFYKTSSGLRYFGIYQFLQPILLVRDVDLIKRICIKDFEHFVDHKSFFTETDEPIFHKNLFGSKGQEWRELRVLLTPAFTGSKMRAMYSLITDCATRFTSHFEQRAKSQNDMIHVEMKDICKRFTIDTIGTCAFGVESDSIAHETNEFYVKGKDVGSFVGIQGLKVLGFLVIPKIMRLFRIRLITKDHTDFFSSLVNKSIKYREEHNIVRPDLLHLMMEARKGKLKHGDERNNTSSDGSFASVEDSSVTKQWNAGNIIIDEDLIVAQSILFFIGGSDSTAISLCFAAHELALHPEIQTRLQDEIDEVFERCQGKVSYEEIMKMKYLDMVISETMRLWPQAFFLDRHCVKDYKIEAKQPGEQDLLIEKGNVVWIPVIGIHRDPQYYPNPEKFDPERFNDENKSSINPYTYLPFGLGPRNCIGNRFALLVAKSFLFQVLHTFNVHVTKNTQIPLKFRTSQIILNPIKGFNLGFELRKK